jgi:hypothetical protein
MLTFPAKKSSGLKNESIRTMVSVFFGLKGQDNLAQGSALGDKITKKQKRPEGAG